MGVHIPLAFFLNKTRFVGSQAWEGSYGIYYIARAVTRYQAEQPEIETEAGLDEAVVAQIPEDERYYQVIANYLARSISLGRAAELLDLPWVDLRGRLHRLGVPVRVGPESIEELHHEVDAIEAWEKHNKKRS